MSYLVLARKWRPQRFSEVVGQSHVTKTLAGAIQLNRLAHAFLFTGVRGVGKTSLARILAMSLNCQRSAEPTTDPCGECASCQAVIAGTALDVIEIDGASNNSVDDIRELRETVPYRPSIGRYKIYVIDEVHMLSTSAFNALLKTLEEPPSHVKFIFATTEPHKIPVTVLSRCQRYDFRRIPTKAITARIREILEQEGIAAEEAALQLISREADGSLRDALSILDQALALGCDKITDQDIAGMLGVVGSEVNHHLSAALLGGDARACLELVRDVDRQGYDLPVFSRGFLQHLRDLVVLGVCQGDRTLVELSDDEAEQLTAQAKSVSVDSLHRIFKHFAEAYEQIARSSHPRILLEASLARIADLGELLPADELLRRLEKLGAGSTPAGTAPTGSSPTSQAPSGQTGGPHPGGVDQGPPAGNSRRGNTPSAEAGQAGRAANPGQASRPLPDSATWETIVEGMRDSQPQLASILECGVPIPHKNGTRLELVYPEECSAAANLAQSPARLAEITGLVSEHCGQPVQVGVRVDTEVVLPANMRRRLEKQEQDRRRVEEAQEHPLVRRAQAELGGKIGTVRTAGDREN